MSNISKTKRESLLLGLSYVLSADFRCYKLDSYTDSTFDDGRRLTRVIGNRCRWRDQLEYTFLMSTSLDTAQNALAAQHAAYLVWKGKVEGEGVLKPVEATDEDLDGEVDRVVIEENADEKKEYHLDDGLWFRKVSEKITESVTMEEVREIIHPIEERYEEALMASGIGSFVIVGRK